MAGERCASVLPAVTRARAGAAAATARGDHRAANAALDVALRSLGRRYADAGQIDDTGQHLGLAEIELDRGHLKQAALMKQSILDERLRLCRR